jgi:hypothetical protein
MPKISAPLEGHWFGKPKTLPSGAEIIEQKSSARDETVIIYTDANGNPQELIVSREALQVALRKVTAE